MRAQRARTWTLRRVRNPAVWGAESPFQGSSTSREKREISNQRPQAFRKSNASGAPLSKDSASYCMGLFERRD